MPKLSGFDLAVQIQEFCPNCKVLMFSGQAATDDLLQSARANGQDFELLLKPVHPQDLLNKIRDIMKDWDPLPPLPKGTAAE